MVLIKDLIKELQKIEKECVGICSLDNITIEDGTIVMFLLANKYEDFNKYLK